MQNRSSADARRSVLLSFVVLGLVSALIILPYMSRTQAVSDDSVKRGLINRTESHVRGLENYDIRLEKSEEVAESLLKFRTDSGKSASAIADIRDSFVRSEEALRSRVSTLKVEYNQDIRTPEVITPDAYKANIERLTGPSREKNAETLRDFAKQYNELVGMDPDQLDELKVIADYTNPRGNMAFAHLEQRINEIPVFRGEIKAGFTVNGELIRVINNLSPGLDYQSLSTDFGNPLNAVRAAAGHINYKLQTPDVTRNDAASSDMRVVFGEGDWATTAEKMYFPTEVGVAIPSWRVLIWEPQRAFYVIVDAETGTMLWRKNIAEDQTQSATYDIYNNANAFMQVSRSPYVWAPGPTNPATPDAATGVPQTSVSLIGNEAPNTFNDNGWITDGGDRTDGNSAQAGLDITSPDGVDVDGEAIEVTPGQRDFQYAAMPFNPNDGTGQSPTINTETRKAGVVSLFYIVNRYHDSMYMLGFNEQSFNFQQSNFGRGGIGNDRVSAESQDSSGTNNANFFTPADGSRGRMQMYRWTLEGPGLDGSMDADIVIHEFTHGLSNRLHGNASGLSSNMPRMMGEGWSDFYSHALLSEATNPANGIYTLSGWATSGLLGGLSSYYYGIRRFPKAPMAFTGGAMNRPHNPITFADIDNTTDDYSDGAFPAPVAGHLSATADQVHSGGEVWSAALWEVRTLMVNRLGFPAGNERALQVVTDGMKLAPLNPSYIQERDAIIMAASALPAAPEASNDVADVREGFRIRGMGFSATVDVMGSGGGSARVTEAFDFPNVQHIDPFSVSDSPGNNNGFPEPGEDVLLSVAVTNTTGATVTNVMVNVSGGTPVAYGNMNDGQTVTMNIPYTVNSGTACGAFEMVMVNVSSDAGSQVPVQREFRLGMPVGGAPATFENTTSIAVPGAGTSGPAAPYPSTINVTGLSGSKVIKVELTNVNHTWVDDVDVLLEGPNGEAYIFMGDAFGNTDPVATTLTFSDAGADGPAPDGGPLAVGDYQPANYTPADVFDAPAPAVTKDAASGDTFQDAFGMDGSTMNGDWKLWIDDDAGGDSGTIGGWKITFESDEYTCGPVAPSGNARADFDGDGRTDKSIFRPSEGNWYIDGSTAGFSVLNWGTSGDTLVPGDYDGDGKTDTAVFRPVDAPGTPDFYILNSNGFVLSGAEWGVTGDVPVVGDYDGDDSDDIAVWRESNGTWYILNSGGGATFTAHGSTGDTPVVGDFDGDNKADLATFNAGTWNHVLSGGGTPTITNGAAGDIAMAGDFDGDGRSDQATWRASNGSWYIWLSDANTQVVYPFGASGDVPVPGDYDGDGKDDLAVYRMGDWWVFSSQSGTASATAFGLASDTPIPSRANP